MSDGSQAALIIPIVAILGAFAIPVTAIIMDYKRRALISAERRAMIEKGMEPPPIDEQGFGRRFKDSPEASLARGIRGLSLAAGLAIGAGVMASGVLSSFIPTRIAGPLALGAVILGAIGLGNLIYYAVMKKKAAESTDLSPR